MQDYLNLPTSLDDVLAQARGLGLGLTLAHQHLGQLPATLRQAVLANARSRVLFQTSASDARVLAKELAPHLDAADLQGLGPYEVVASIAVGCAGGAASHRSDIAATGEGGDGSRRSCSLARPLRT